jgi:TPR repeat protein
VTESASMARKWFERGVAQGNGLSYYGLGMMHFNGEAGLEKDYKLALKHLSEAAAKDNAAGMAQLAELLMSTIN